MRKAPVELTVVDQTNHHLFTPLLYQVATAGLSAPSVAGPIRHILAKQRNATVLLGEVRKILPASSGACFGSVSGASRYDRPWPRLRARQKGLALGADGYITKRALPSTRLDAVQAILPAKPSPA